MKQRTAQSGRMWQNARLVFCINKEVLSIRNDITTELLDHQRQGMRYQVIQYPVQHTDP